MALVIEEEFLPVRLTSPPMSDEEFAEFCSHYPDYFIEMTAEGEIIIMPANFSEGAAQSGEILYQLKAWARRENRGVVTDSSGGFVLPSGARRSPDAAWTLRERVAALEPQARHGFWHLAPDFVIELRSKTDRLPTLRRKMAEWVANGTQLAWLIDPERRAVEIYKQDGSEILLDADSITAGPPVDGFQLELKRVWDPLGLESV